MVPRHSKARTTYRQRAIVSRVAVTAGIAVLVCSGCRRAQEPDASRPDGIVTVGERVITEADVLREVQRLRGSGRRVPEKTVLVKQMIEHAAAVQQALADSIDEDPEAQRAVEDLWIAKWRDRELARRTSHAAIGDEELKQAYEQRRSDYVTPGKVRLAILKLDASPHMSSNRQAEVEGRMVEARERALTQPKPKGRGPAGTGFGALAIDYSDDTTSRFRGGDIGWLEVGNVAYRWPRQVLETGYALAEGAVSEILKTTDGYYLVMKTDERPAVTNSFDASQASLRRALTIERQNRARLSMHQDVLAAFPAEIDQDKLDRLKLPQSHETASLGIEDAPPAWPKGGSTP